MAVSSAPTKKKVLENPLLVGAVVPTAIVLVAVVIIWGVTQLLTAEKNYRELIEEMNSKTFGNRWVAAFELSKILSNKKIPAEETPWLRENLQKNFESNADPRTRNFIVLALSSVADKNDPRFFEKAMLDPDPQVKFSAVVSLGNLNPGIFKEAETLLSFIDSSDVGLAQASIFVLAHHKISAAQPKLRELLTHSDPNLKYAAATALIVFKDESSLPLLRKLLLQQDLGGQFNPEQTQNLKIRVINALQSYQWSALNPELVSVAENRTNLKLSTEAMSALNFLKN